MECGAKGNRFAVRRVLRNAGSESRQVFSTVSVSNMPSRFHGGGEESNEQEICAVRRMAVDRSRTLAWSSFASARRVSVNAIASSRWADAIAAFRRYFQGQDRLRLRGRFVDCRP